MFVEKLTEYLNDNGIEFEISNNVHDVSTHVAKNRTLHCISFIITTPDGFKYSFNQSYDSYVSKYSYSHVREKPFEPYDYIQFDNYVEKDIDHIIEVVYKFLHEHNMLPSYILK